LEKTSNSKVTQWRPVSRPQTSRYGTRDSLLMLSALLIRVNGEIMWGRQHHCFVSSAIHAYVPVDTAFSCQGLRSIVLPLMWVICGQSTDSAPLSSSSYALSLIILLSFIAYIYKIDIEILDIPHQPMPA
jgi:hypothetical protein